MNIMNLDAFPPLPPSHQSPAPSKTKPTSKVKINNVPSRLNTLCPICNSAISPQYTCPSCHQLTYCSESCLDTDCPYHNRVCSKFTSLTSRPSPNHRLAFFFPTKGPTPVVTWLKIVPGDDEADDVERDGIEALFCKSELEDHDLQVMIITENAQRLRTIKGAIVVLYVQEKTRENRDENSEEEEEEEAQEDENDAIKTLIGTGEDGKKKWRIPVLTFALHPQGSKKGVFKVRDFEIAEFRDVVDVLQMYGPRSKIIKEKLAVDVSSLKPGKRVQVQIVKCLRAKGSTYNASGRAAAISDTQLAAIRENGGFESMTFSNMIGLPVRMYPLTSAVKKFGSKAQSNCHGARNPCDLLTHVGVMRWHGMNPDEISMGFYKKDCPGAALYLREDGKPLTTQQFDAIFGLSRAVGHGFYNAFDASKDLLREQRLANDALMWATKNKYVEFFEKLRTKFLNEGREEWEDAEPF